MIRSMTGWGEAERSTPAGRLRMEVKTVNHRFFNANVKTPFGFDRFESDITQVLRERLRRGHVSAVLTLDRTDAQDAGVVSVDLDRARAYYRALEAIRSEFDLASSVDIGVLARFSDIFRAPTPDATPADLEPQLVRDLTVAAAEEVSALREMEGARLRADLEDRLEAIARSLDEVEARAPRRLVEERDRLRDRIRELAEQTEVDDDRLAREVAYLADKWDINEEIVRFRSHIELFRETMGGDGERSVGKRLGFLGQEMLREANTIASKANDAVISHAAVAMKEEIERLREQLENVE